MYGSYTNNDLGLLVFPKINQHEIQDLKTDTVYSKSVTNMDFNQKLLLLNNMFALEDYESDTLLHPVS